MADQRNKRDREPAALLALSRYSQFLIHEGCAIGARDYMMRLSGFERERKYIQRLGEAIAPHERQAIEEQLEIAKRQQKGCRPMDWPELVGHLPESPIAMALGSGSGLYDEYMRGEVSSSQLNNLLLFFQAELSRHPWGRVLFFLIMGGDPNRDGVVPCKLPRFLYPSQCILPGCDNAIVFKKSPSPRRVCIYCDPKDWNSSSKKAERGIATVLRRAFEIVFDYGQSSEINIQEKFYAIWEGYIELCRYPLTKVYRPFALKWTPYQGLPATTLSESLSRLLVLPNERHKGLTWQGMPANEFSQYGATAKILRVGREYIATFSKVVKDFELMARFGGSVYLPVQAFKENAIQRKTALPADEISAWFRPVVRDGVDNSDFCHGYKLISCYQDSKGKPIGVDGTVDSDNYILLSALDKFQV